MTRHGKRCSWGKKDQGRHTIITKSTMDPKAMI